LAISLREPAPVRIRPLSVLCIPMDLIGRPSRRSTLCAIAALATTLGPMARTTAATSETVMSHWAANRLRDFIVADAKLGLLPAIKVFRIASYAGIPILLNVVEHGTHTVGQRATVLTQLRLGIL
jgi:hypothetical protein